MLLFKAEQVKSVSRCLPTDTWSVPELILYPHCPPPFPGCLAGQAQSGGGRPRVAQKGKGKCPEEEGDRSQAAKKSARTGGFQGAHFGCSGATGPG